MIDFAVWIEDRDGELRSYGNIREALLGLIMICEGLWLMLEPRLEVLKGMFLLITPSASKSYMSSYRTLFIRPLISGSIVRLS